MCHCQAVSPYCGHLAGPIRHLLWWSFEGLQVPCSILTSALRGRKAGVLGQSGWWAELGLELRSWVGASCTSSLLCATGDCKAHFAQSAGSGPVPSTLQASPHLVLTTPGAKNTHPTFLRWQNQGRRKVKNLLKIPQLMSVGLKVSQSLVHSMQPSLCQPELLFSVL